VIRYFLIASYRNLVFLQFGMEICRIFKAGIGSSSGILLSIPFTCTLKALTGTAKVILFLEVNLCDLFLSVGRLTETTGLR